MFQLTGRVALVTGAASGIGRATAMRLGHEGALLFLADLDEAGLRETVAGLGDDVESKTFVLDVADPAACQRAVTTCVETFGKLDILANIAGIALCDHMTAIKDEQWERMLGTNLSGVFYMCRAAMPHLVETQGCVVNMASSAGLEGQAYNSAYCATKAGVLMFSKSLALEFSKQRVRVNAVCPGHVNTPLVEKFNFPEGGDMALLGRLVPLLDAAEPAEIAAAVTYLCTDDARFITGIGLPIDGGQTAG